jgi:hypothetical protein
MSHRPTSNAGARGAILAAAILAAICFGLEDAARTAPLGPPDSEPEPHVKPAIDGVLDLFKHVPVVALGDWHGLAQEELFYDALVHDPRFAKQVGNVVVEFGGSEAQDIIDRYASGKDVPFAELRHVWTDVVGWLPGPFALGYVNFFANVRAVNLRLPDEDRIKVWLGDPKIDWTQIMSFRDLEPILMRRDDNISGIIVDEILKRHKKTLLIVGTGHLVGMESGRGTIPAPLVAKISEANPNALAIVSPFAGYIEPECNAKVVAWAKDWPVPAVAGPIEGTSLKSELLLPGCNYLTPEQVEQMKKMFAAGRGVQWLGPGKPPDMISSHIDMRSGVKSDAILYLGPPDTLTQSPCEPSIYLDPDYFKEMNRRAQCCVPTAYTLDWDNIVQQNSVVPRKFQPR